MGISLEGLLRQLGINPGDVAVDVPTGRQPYYGHTADPGAVTDKTQSYSVASGTALDTRESFVVGWVIVDNNSSAWINIPDATRDGTGRFVGPGLGGAFPILGHISRSRINWIAPSGKAQPAFVAGEQAQVVFGSGPTPPGFGFAAPISPLRWNINANPGAGVQASVSRAGSPGVTHVGDSFIVSMVDNTAAGIGTARVIDGPSGGANILDQVALGVTATASSSAPISAGPGLNLRGTPGNAMTVEFAAAVAGVFESVSLSGFDQ